MSDVEVAEGGGWISGPSVSTPPLPAPAAQYNPAKLVDDVRALLGAQGVRVGVNLGFGGNATAVTAASDLLRALHVEPASVPRLSS